MTARWIDDRRERSYPNPWGAQTGTSYRVLCSDGRVRTAVATAEADTFFSLPARVQVRGRTVSGYVSGRDHARVGLPADGPRYEFHPYLYRRNHDALPEMPATDWDRMPTYTSGPCEFEGGWCVSHAPAFHDRGESDR